MPAYDKDDIQCAAASMIANHGGYAAHLAVKRARNLLGEDAKDARQTWRRILQAIRQMQPESVSQAPLASIGGMPLC